MYLRFRSHQYQFMVLMFSLVSFVVSSLAFAEGEKRPYSIGYEADKLTQCVAPTEYMRSNHMEIILHERDLTVHEGIRVKDKSLSECINCHVSRDETGKPIAINEEGQFCERCHEFAAVNIDCFQCHSTVPNPDAGWTAFNHPIVTPDTGYVLNAHQGFMATVNQSSALDSEAVSILTQQNQDN